MAGRIGTVALSALALILVACTTSSTPPARHPSNGLIAWISTPAPPTTSTTTTTTTLAPAPLCTKAELRVRFVAFGAAASMWSDVFQLTNVSNITCRLQGQPELFPSAVPATPVSAVGRHGYLPLRVIPGNIAPRAVGYLLIMGTDECTPAPAGSRLKPTPYKYARIVLPNGEGSFVTSEIPPCAPADLGVGVEPVNPYLLPPAPGTLASLDVVVQLPKRIVGGRLLHFVVVLANRGAVAVPLKPCPGYLEGTYPWYASTPPLQRSYQLNCGRLRLLAPHHHLRFAMQLPILRVTQPLSVRFGWDLITGSGPWTDTLVTVQP